MLFYPPSPSFRQETGSAVHPAHSRQSGDVCDKVEPLRLYHKVEFGQIRRLLLFERLETITHLANRAQVEW